MLSNTNMNASESGWMTVTKRGSAWGAPTGGAPAGRTDRSAAFAAFGSSRDSRGSEPRRADPRRADPRRVDRRHEQQQYRAAAEFDKKVAKDAEERRLIDALNFTSESAYPSLSGSGSGSSGSSSNRVKATAMNFAVAAAAPAAAPATPAAATVATTTVIPVRPRTIVTHCYDELPEDYDGPDEDAMSDHESVQEGEGCDGWVDDSDNNEGQFNAALMDNRRRGDNGIW
jgi:hypothetical protein